MDPSYLPTVRKAIEKGHGHALRTLNGRVVSIEGPPPPKNVAIVEWDSVDDAVAFYKSKAWTDMAPQREKAQKTIRVGTSSKSRSRGCLAALAAAGCSQSQPGTNASSEAASSCGLFISNRMMKKTRAGPVSGGAQFREEYGHKSFPGLTRSPPRNHHAAKSDARFGLAAVMIPMLGMAEQAFSNPHGAFAKSS